MSTEPLAEPPVPPPPPEAPAVGFLPAEPEPARPRLTFWQEPWVQNLLPLFTSLAFHLALIIIGLATYKAVRQITEPPKEQIIIPEAAIVEGAEVGGLPNPGLGGDPNLAAAQNVDPNVSTAEGWADRRSESLTSTLMGGGSSDAADSVIGLGARSGLMGSGGTGTGGTAGESGGALAPFGVPGGGQGQGPKSPFMGISGNARKVIYIVDASGSMMQVFPRVKDELRRAIDVLRPIQAFNVIFFSRDEVSALSRGPLVMANPENKRKAYQLAADTASAGSTDPLPAIRLAFEQGPDLIYVLTDGFENVVSFDAVIEEFRRLNVHKRVKVNTILIRSQLDPELERVVRTIASESGGICKIIARDGL